MTAAYAHPEYRQLLAGVLAAPADDAPRLIVADWLDEHGCGERAAWIRERVANPDQVGAWGLRGVIGSSEWFPGPGRTIFVTVPVAEAVRLEVVWSVGGERYIFAYPRRGFVEAVTCTAADWLAHADAILAEHPVTAVTLTTMPARSWDFLHLWPGIAFALPPEPVPADGWDVAIDPGGPFWADPEIPGPAIVSLTQTVPGSPAVEPGTRFGYRVLYGSGVLTGRAILRDVVPAGGETILSAVADGAPVYIMG
jgi:uncharacterized protein (TIGR02996 family)